MRNINLDQLQTLVTAADLGSLAAAARALHLSAPSVSLHISELETRVGASLLLRGKGKATLTPAGEVLVSRGRRLLAGSEQILESARRRAQGSAGTLRLATTAGVEPELLPRLLDALELRVPGIELRLDASGSRESLARLRSGTLDLAIVATPLDPGLDIELLPWRSDPMIALLPPSWDLPPQVSAHWLSRRPWMSFGPPTQMHALIVSWFERSGERSRPRFELNQPEALKILVEAGHGAALLPSTLVTKGHDGWAQVRPLEPALRRSLAIARRRADLDPLVTRSLEVLRTLAACRAEEG